MPVIQGWAIVTFLLSFLLVSNYLNDSEHYHDSDGPKNGNIIIINTIPFNFLVSWYRSMGFEGQLL